METIKCRGQWAQNDTLTFRVVAEPCPRNNYREETVSSFELAIDAVRCCQWHNERFPQDYYFIGGPLSPEEMEQLEAAGY